MRIAFIDDRPENRHSWQAAMDAICDTDDRLATFSRFAELAKAIEHGYAPDIVFVDFFISGNYGTQVIDYLRDCFGTKVFIIAHSSMDLANDAMICGGANAKLAKLKGTYPSQTILDAFPDRMSLTKLTSNCNGARKADASDTMTGAAEL